MYQLEITFWFTCQILLVLAPSGGRIFKNWIRHSLDQNWDGSLVLTFDKVPLSIDFRNVLILVGHIKCNISFKVNGDGSERSFESIMSKLLCQSRILGRPLWIKILGNFWTWFFKTQITNLYKSFLVTVFFPFPASTKVSDLEDKFRMHP